MFYIAMIVYIFMTKKKISAGQMCPLLAHCNNIVIACCWIKKLERNEAITCTGVFSFHYILSDGIISFFPVPRDMIQSPAYPAVPLPGRIHKEVIGVWVMFCLFTL